jgi:hypothetical protein
MKIKQIAISFALISTSATGFILSKEAFAQSDKADSTASKSILVVCGPHGAPRVVDSGKIPPGCRASTVNAPPAGS